MSAALEVTALRKRFDGHAVLEGVCFSVAPGELVTILGKSGSGKTTLLRLICGFDRADGGTIAIGGQVASGGRRHMPPERRGIGYVAQEGALFPHLTVGENVLFGLPRVERREARAAALLDRVGLAPSFSRRGPHQLSGGEQQRVALARALAPSPELVLLDEPFSALDAALRKESRRAVATSLAETGTAAILVTHDQAEALSLGHRVGVLRGGHLVQIDSPTILYQRPVDLDLARFVGEALVLPAEAHGAAATCCLGEVPLQATAQGRVSLLLRPEQLRLEPDGPGHVRAVDFLGPQATVEIDLEGTAVTAIVPGHRVPVRGERIGVRVEGTAVAYASER